MKRTAKASSITRVIIAVNGNPRAFYVKMFGSELRAYRIEGDVSNMEELKECAQELAIEFKASRVTICL